MSAKNIASIFDIGADILSSERNTINGTLNVTIGSSVEEETRSVGAEWWQHIGFASLPSNPNAGKPSAQTISIVRSGRDVCFASRDVRSNSIYGQLNPGETCVYAAGPNGTGTNRFLQKDDGTIATQTMLVQAGNISSGNPTVVQISSDDGGKVNIAAGTNGAISIDSSGIKMASSHAIQFGSTSGDITLIGSSLALNAGNVSLGANAVNPIALATPITALMTAITAYTVAVNAILGTGAVIILDPTGTLVSTLNTTFTALTTALSFIPQISSTSVFAAF